MIPRKCKAPRDSSLGVLLCVGRLWNGETLLCCNVCYGSPERVELSGGQFDSVKSSLDSWPR